MEETPLRCPPAHGYLPAEPDAHECRQAGHDGERERKPQVDGHLAAISFQRSAVSSLALLFSSN